MQGVATKDDASYDLSRARASVTGQTTIAASTATTSLPNGRIVTALFAGALFLSAFLLFVLEPMVAKSILPTLDGTPMVWNARLLGTEVRIEFATTSITIFAIVVLTLPHFTVAQPRATETTMTTSTIHIPKSVQAEHEAIHSALVEATQAPGRIGTAAKALAAVLHPHFVREEQIALPPLGLLAPLATGDHLPEPVVSEALAMTDALKSELPRMLEEHKKIHAAVDTLRLAARAEQATKYEQLAEQLALHAQTEEEVLYPAAVLVGDIIRARLQSR